MGALAFVIKKLSFVAYFYLYITYIDENTLNL